MAKKEIKTNVMRILDKAGIKYESLSYEVDDGLIDGKSVAQKVNAPMDAVYKTLVTIGSNKEYYVFVIPVEHSLDLKGAAKCAGVKSIDMIPQKDLLNVTGYIHGGCSPIGMKKSFPTFYDESVKEHDFIYVSAGKVGYQIKINPDDLMLITDGHYYP